MGFAFHLNCRGFAPDRWHEAWERTHWTEDCGRLILDPPYGMWPYGVWPGYVLWLPRLSVSPSTWHPTPDDPTETFTARFDDAPATFGSATFWWMSDPAVVDFLPPDGRTTSATYTIGLVKNVIISPERFNYGIRIYSRIKRRSKYCPTGLCVASSRHSRNYEDILEQWRVLIKVKKANIRVLNMPLLDTTNKANGLVGTLVADLVLQLFSFVAESERANIRERQREGIDAALRRGVKFGRPEVGNAKEIAKCVNGILNGKLSVEDAAKTCRVSCTTIRRRINNVSRKYAMIQSA